MRIRPSITQYALVFILFIVLSFVILGFTIYNQFTDLESRLNAKQVAESAAALRLNLAQLDQLIVSTAKDIADWQETHQQIDRPGYYEYWRDSRVKSQSFYIEAMQSVELYDIHGKAISQSIPVNMPTQLERFSGFAVMRTDHGHDVYYATPIKSTERGNRGYVLVNFQLEPSLQEYYPVPGIDMQSLSFDVELLHVSSLTHLVLVANYETTINEHVDALHNLVNINLLNSALLIIFLSAVFIISGTLLILNPVRRLARRIYDLKEFHAQPDKIQACEFYVKELQLVCNSIDEYHLKLSEMHADLDEKNQELWAQAHHDPLTGVYNRRAFELDWQHIETAIQGRRIDIAFMLIDCDRFKILNDTYGHDIGDKVLQEVTKRISHCLRASDKLYRLGGDEFATLFIDASQQEALHVAERCIEQVNTIDADAMGIGEPIKISIGLACTPATNLEKLHELHQQADTAMYHAKRPGKNKISVYDDTMLNDSLVLLNNRITSAVHNAVTIGNTIELHYQAIVDCKTDKIGCYEVLTRIRDKDRLMLPSKIFPVVHDRRIELEFDTAVINKLSQQLDAGELPANSRVALNLSGLSILSKSVVDRLLSLITRQPGYQFCLEITETALITRLQQASENLELIREAGFQIMLDDFGSGYSSFRYLTKMPIDGIKFDVSLVHALSVNNKDSVIVESLARMVLEAGYQLVAEGIEDENLYNKIKTIGFTWAQGYYLHKPSLAKDLSHTV